MPTTLVTNMQAAVGAGGTHDVIPPAGHEYLITKVGNDVAFVGNVPDIQLAIRDGVVADAIVFIDPTTTPNCRQRDLELYLTNGNHMRLTNTGAGAGNLSWFGKEIQPGTARVDLVTIGAGASVDVQPPAGETWKITTLGSSTWNAAGYPDIALGLTDGVLQASMIVQATMVRGWTRNMAVIVDNNVYMRLTDISGAGIVAGYSGVRIPQPSISSITDVAGGATLDIIPPANQEWCITDIGAETWGGLGAPNNYPDITVSLMVGANLSDIMEAGSVATSLNWNETLELYIDTTHYLRITEVSAANNEVCVSGYLKRSWS
jgi:hypothetical protein